MASVHHGVGPCPGFDSWVHHFCQDGWSLWAKTMVTKTLTGLLNLHTFSSIRKKKNSVFSGWVSLVRPIHSRQWYYVDAVQTSSGIPNSGTCSRCSPRATLHTHDIHLLTKWISLVPGSCPEMRLKTGKCADNRASRGTAVGRVGIKEASVTVVTEVTKFNFG